GGSRNWLLQCKPSTIVSKKTQSTLPKVISGVRAHKIKRRRQAARAIVSARVSDHVTLQICTNGQIIASSEGSSVDLGTFSAGAAKFAQGLHIGLPVASFRSSRRNFDKEIHLLIRQLAGHGLLEY